MIEVVNVPFTIFILTQRNICVGEGKNHVTLGLPSLVIKFKTVLLMIFFLFFFNLFYIGLVQTHEFVIFCNCITLTGKLMMMYDRQKKNYCNLVLMV